MKAALSPSRQNRIYWLLALATASWLPVLAALRVSGVWS